MGKKKASKLESATDSADLEKLPSRLNVCSNQSNELRLANKRLENATYNEKNDRENSIN